MDQVFSHIYVINLTRCPERKQHMIQQFKKIRTANYQFLEAIDKDTHIVNQAFRDGNVFKYPPCFRCKKAICNHLNNTLTNSQVANWFSHKKAWNQVLENKDQLALICEDDLVFNPYWGKAV